jgi:hypothetical protein
LLRRIDDEEERNALARRVFEETRELSARLQFLELVGHGENVGHKLVPLESWNEWSRELQDKIVTSSEEDLLQERDILLLFGLCRHRDDLKSELQRHVRSNDLLLATLRSGITYNTSWNMGDAVSVSRPVLPWDFLSEIFGAEFLSSRVPELIAAFSNEQAEPDVKTVLELASGWLQG